MSHQPRELVLRLLAVTSLVFGSTSGQQATGSTTVPPGSQFLGVTIDGRLQLDGKIDQAGSDGRTTAAGNVLMYNGGRLWTVCDDGWDRRAAAVACRSLGYATAVGYTTQSHFGQPGYGKAICYSIARQR